jgi:hypothetical protein
MLMHDDFAQFQPAFNGVNTLLAVSTNIETEQITNGNFKLKGKSSFTFDRVNHQKESQASSALR